MDVDRIVSSVEYYDEIAEWIEKLAGSAGSEEFYEISTGLVQVFGRLAKQGSLGQKLGKKEAKISRWLTQQLEEFYDLNLANVSRYPEVCVPVALKLLLVQGKYQGVSISEQVYKLINAASEVPAALEELQPVLAEYDDLRFHFYEAIPRIAHMRQLLPLMCSFEKVIAENKDLSQIYTSKTVLPFQPKQAAQTYRDVFQKAWIHALRQQDITPTDLKGILTVMHARIIPNLLKPQLLMDFLVDAYDQGGAISLLSLNALFALIQYHQLEFPNFFTKLYELLEDGSILVSSHRSRFLRLVDLFLTSTHLPAIIPASIIKRLARLCLFAPPGAIVAVIPFVYNQLKRHPTCMVMIHRANGGLVGGDDPFNNDEKDPLLTHALDSSLWELQALTTHYHPNVAALAKIFSQPFRKPSYQLDHFLSHSYETLYATEHHRKRDKEPGLEFEDYNVFTDLGDTWTI